MNWAPLITAVLALFRPMPGASAAVPVLVDDDQSPAPNTNMSAFLWMLRSCEGTAGANGYNLLYGGTTFTSWADHPRIKFWPSGRRVDPSERPAPFTFTTAAGAFQITETTWNDFTKACGPHDFSPASQEACALWLIRLAGAEGDITAGRLDAAIDKLGGRWASLPSATAGQPKRTRAYCQTVYQQAGGVLA